MALDRIGLAMIAPHVKGAAVLALGYPDLTANQADVLSLLGQATSTDDCIATRTVLLAAGATAFDVVDVIAHKGFERIVDLNQPQEWPRRYGLVINPGTLEHCFNLGQAWANAWRALAPGGAILHVCPATMLNHGFWNICPVAIEDWCAANAGRVREMRFAQNGTQQPVAPRGIPGAATGRPALPAETVMYALCQKLADAPLAWPVQGCYRR